MVTIFFELYMYWLKAYNRNLILMQILGQAVNAISQCTNECLPTASYGATEITIYNIIQTKLITNINNLKF